MYNTVKNADTTNRKDRTMNASAGLTTLAMARKAGRAIRQEVRTLQAATGKAAVATAERELIEKAEQFFPGVTPAKVARSGQRKQRRYIELLTDLVDIEKI